MSGWPLVDFSTAPPYTQKLDVVNGSPDGIQPGYVGWSAPGTPTSAAGWKIRKFIYSGNVLTDIQWMNGSVKFDQIWDQRVTGPSGANTTYK